MNPFELTKDPDGGGTTVRVKHGFVVLTREEEKQITERITEILTENAKLRELVRDMMEFFEDGDWCVKCERARDCQAQEQYEDECLMRFVFRDRMRELGVEI